MTNFIPLSERVVVERDVAPEKQGAIIVPDMAKEKPVTGTVLYVANDCDERLEVGAKVLFSKYAGMEVNLTDKPVIVLKQADIIGIIK